MEIRSWIVSAVLALAPLGCLSPAHAAPAAAARAPQAGPVGATPPANPVGSLAQGSRPASFRTFDIQGKPLSLDQYQGKVVLVHFWTSWCPMCRVEVPNVVAAYKKYHAKGLEVIGVSMDDRLSTAQVKEYVRQSGIAWRVAHDIRGWDSPLVKPYGVDYMPFSLLIGKDGRIAAVNPRGAELDPAVEKALKG